MKRVGFVYDEVLLRHEPPSWHPDTGDRLVNIIITLKAAGLWPKLTLIKPREAEINDIARVHTR